MASDENLIPESCGGKEQSPGTVLGQPSRRSGFAAKPARTIIPESYSTAWTCLHGNLQIESGQTLLLRGATSALGQAALNIAANAGLNVIATTRNKSRFEKLLGLGAQRMEIEGPGLSKRLPEAKKAAACRLTRAIASF